jgi:hypothetical protein
MTGATTRDSREEQPVTKTDPTHKTTATMIDFMEMIHHINGTVEMLNGKRILSQPARKRYSSAFV